MKIAQRGAPINLMLGASSSCVGTLSGRPTLDTHIINEVSSIGIHCLGARAPKHTHTCTHSLILIITNNI